MKAKITFILLYSLILICSCATKDQIFKHKLTNLKPDYFSSEDNLIYVGRITSDAKVENTIGIEGMIPDSIYLDGELVLFEKF